MDLLISSGWKVNRLRLANQTRLWLQVYYVSDLLLLGTNRIKRCFLQGKKDVSIYSEFNWPVVQINAECISVWKSAISDISTCDGSLRQSLRWTSKGHSHFETNAWVNADHSVLCINVSDTEAKYYLSNNFRSSHRHKRCPSPQDFTPAAKIWVDAKSADCIWSRFSRTTLHTSIPRPNLSAF